jgi:hypothetical protein
MAGFDIVHVVTGYYDGVLDGIADYQGRPHRFQIGSIDGVADDRYELTPLSEQAFAAAMETWEIWRRWEAAYRAGGVPDFEVKPFPALPADRARQQELEGIVSAALTAAKAKAFRARGDFRPLLEGAWCGTERGALQVCWTTDGTT